MFNVLAFPVVFHFSINSSKVNFNNNVHYFLITSYVLFFSITYLNLENFSNTEPNALTINSIYYLVFILPFVLLINKRILRFLLISIISFVTIYSLKRTAILALFFALSFYLFDFFSEKKTKTIYKLLLILFIATFIFSLIFLEFSTLSLTINRFLELSNDGGSGRLSIFTDTLSTFFSSSFVNLFFGYGYDGVNSLFGISSHNDFIEMLFNFGLIGFIVYFYFIVSLFLILIKLKKIQSNFYNSFKSSLVLFLVISFGSHLVFTPTYFLIITVYWGTIINHYYLNSRNTNYNLINLII
jgi:O-antigen ligase